MQLKPIEKFGNGEDGVGLIAAELAQHFRDLVESCEFPHGAKFLPGIYNAI